VRRSATQWEWEDVPGFSVGDHIREHTLPPGSGEEALRAYASAEMMRDLPRDRPLWLVHVVHGYQGGSALLWRLHHCIGDGIALMVLMLAITDLDPDADLRRGPNTWGSDNPLASHSLGNMLMGVNPGIVLISFTSTRPCGSRTWTATASRRR